MSANVLVVPALPEAIPDFSDAATVDPTTLQYMHRLLRRTGIDVVTLPGLPTTSEYELDNDSARREGLADYIARQEGLVGTTDAVVVVNDAAERVRDPSRQPICDVPYAVGRLASGIIEVANRAYGPDSGRVFLSHRYPDISALSSVDPSRRTVNMARIRLLGVYPLHPVALMGQYDRLVEVAKTHHDQEATT